MRILLLFIMLLSFGGCRSTGGRVAVETLPASSLYTEPSWEKSKGEYHKVKRGETLYSICSLYGVELADVIKANHLKDASKIRENQLIYIPFGSSKRVLPSSDFIWPVRGSIVSRFQDSTSKGSNKGIDIKLTSPQTVVAAGSGEVCYSGEDIKGYNKVIMIDHGAGLYSLYAYNDSMLVKKGDRVKAGDSIASIDREGGMLHFEIRRDNTPLDPLKFLKQ